jgi:FolB domain-containing protein
LNTSLDKRAASEDTITIHQLELWTRIGVPASEREHPQRLLATIEMATDCLPAAHSDDVTDALDYTLVADSVKRLAARHPRKLIETLAEEIAQCVLTEFGATRVTVALQKFPFTDAHSVTVKITRKHHA